MPNTLPHITVRDALGNQREIEISRTPFTLGRQGDNDLVLLDTRISRRHARIVKDNEAYLLEDAGSRHGTFLNGERVAGPCRLKSGDQISLGVSDSYSLAFGEEEAVLPSLLEKFGKAAEESSAPQLHHLGMLLQMAQMMLRAPALEEVLTTLLDSAIQLANAERGLLFLKEGKGELQLRMGRGKGGIYLSPEVTDFSRTVVDRVAATGQEEVVLEDASSGRTAMETGIIRTGSRGIVAVPLQKLHMADASGETFVGRAPEMLGLLYLDTRSQAAAVTGLDRQVLQTLAMEGSTVIENARLFRLAREQERIQHEMFLARNIQQGLLPRELPQSDYFQVVSVTTPTEAVGGDYYDVLEISDGRYGFALADVSGKGLPAALMAASLQGAFGAVAAGAPDLAELFRRVNDYLCDRTPPEMFATLLYGVLDRDGGYEFVNAGHIPPLIVRAQGGLECLESSNFPMGLFPRVEFTGNRAQLYPGDLIVTTSDGVTEARDSLGGLFGDARLHAILEGCSGQTADEVVKHILAGVRQFVGTAPQSDDLTVSIVRYGSA
ncbi:MAG TPA: SpoIIE family protein phosphatase [Terriglobia bacterium]|nr:SpoIIE family protein phosphatase [Terriglobia bacterium]